MNTQRLAVWFVRAVWAVKSRAIDFFIVKDYNISEGRRKKPIKIFFLFPFIVKFHALPGAPIHASGHLT